MPKAARIVFARDSAANVAAASDVFASHRSAYFCVACGQELQRTVPENGFPYFRHAHRATCRLSAHYALRAAAQHILLESRFIKAPIVGGEPGAGRVPSFLIQWTDSIADIEVVHVPVDFLAETADGQLIVEIAIPGLSLTVPLERVEKLEVPALIVSLPEPARIHGWADLRHYVLHSIENKSWLIQRAKRPSWVTKGPRSSSAFRATISISAQLAYVFDGLQDCQGQPFRQRGAHFSVSCSCMQI
jgi:hypothetical protein